MRSAANSRFGEMKRWTMLPASGARTTSACRRSGPASLASSRTLAAMTTIGVWTIVSRWRRCASLVCDETLEVDRRAQLEEAGRDHERGLPGRAGQGEGTRVVVLDRVDLRDLDAHALGELPDRAGKRRRFLGRQRHTPVTSPAAPCRREGAASSQRTARLPGRSGRPRAHRATTRGRRARAPARRARDPP